MVDPVKQNIKNSLIILVHLLGNSGKSSIYVFIFVFGIHIILII